MESSHESPGRSSAEEVTGALERLIRLFRRLSPPSDYSLTALATLAVLERSGPRRLTDLAVDEGVSQPAMTQLVSRLQDAGMVTRATDPADGRVVRIGITDTGRASLSERRTTRIDRLAALLVQLDPADQAALTSALPAIEALARLAHDDLSRNGASS